MLKRGLHRMSSLRKTLQNRRTGTAANHARFNARMAQRPASHAAQNFPRAIALAIPRPAVDVALNSVRRAASSTITITVPSPVWRHSLRRCALSAGPGGLVLRQMRTFDEASCRSESGHPEMLIASTLSPLRPDSGRIAAPQRASGSGQKRRTCPAQAGSSCPLSLRIGRTARSLYRLCDQAQTVRLVDVKLSH
jgi:hypothetical protein